MSKKVFKEKYSLKTTDTLTIKIVKGAYYLIKIQGRAKSEKQRKRTDDEEIIIKIDEKTFPKQDTKDGLKNSPASFNGGKLHNKEQVIYFVTYLEIGSHTIELKPQYGDGAEIIEVNCQEINVKDNKINLNVNQQLEDRDKKPWITFVLVDIGIKIFSIETKVKWHWLDGDDIKVIINGEIQKAKTIFRKDWIIKTNPLDIFGKTETINLTPNLSIQNHNYIELYADKTPTLKSINFELISEQSGDLQTLIIQPYKDKIYNNDYNKLDEYILSAVDYWNNFFSKQQYSPPKLLDPNLVKAIIYRESKLGYYPDDKIIDVMQDWDRENKTPQHMIPEIGYEDKANEFVSEDEYAHMNYSYPLDQTPPNVSTPKESIFWGVRWLYHKAQFLPDLIKPYKREWRTWESAIRKYNSNEEIVEAYIKEVFLIYEKGMDLKGNVLWEK